MSMRKGISPTAGAWCSGFTGLLAGFGFALGVTAEAGAVRPSERGAVFPRSFCVAEPADLGCLDGGRGMWGGTY